MRNWNNGIFKINGKHDLAEEQEGRTGGQDENGMFVDEK